MRKPRTSPPTHRLASVAVVATCLLFAVAGAASALGGSQASDEPLVVAVESPQSGDQASNGLDMLRGVRLAVDQFNARGGFWDGRKAEVYAADDKGNADKAKAVGEHIVGKGIRFVIGPYNSSVGVVNLPIYRRNKVLPLWMTSLDETRGIGVTVQPMNSQIAPIEERYSKSLGAKRVTMLVDDTANGAFTKGMAQRLRNTLRRDGERVTWISIREISSSKGSPAAPHGYYADQVREALKSDPDLIYVSTYFPEGVQIAKALYASGNDAKCLMGLANVDNGFVEKTTLPEAQRCVFSGVPAASQMPSARTYVRQFAAAFSKKPGVWGSFTYDSAGILFAAIDRAKSYEFAPVQKALRATSGYTGATGAITIDRTSGYRVTVPVSILRVDAAKTFVITGR